MTLKCYQGSGKNLEFKDPAVSESKSLENNDFYIFTLPSADWKTGKASDKPVIMQECNTFKSQSYSFIEVPGSAAGDNVMALHGMKFSVQTLSSRDQELRLAIVQISLSKFHYTRTGKKKWQTVHVCAQGTG